jgi:KaiC/GvpD/RAD55 family RecA-like ATPase
VKAPLTLTSLSDLLDEPDEPIDWILENRIPAGGIVLLAAPPKAGKSTLARELALCVATGSPFLGWSTTPGRVWYFAFQDKRKEIKRHFRRLGAARSPLELFIDQAPADVVSQFPNAPRTIIRS